MRLSLAFLLFFTFQNLFAQTNVAYRGAYPFPNNELANLWGYADGNGNEYALVGTQTGMSIINVTTPTTPTLVIDITGPFSDWREIKTYGHYAYVVTEGVSGTNVGLMIINLSYLPNINVNNTNHFRVYRGDGAINNLFNKAHALHVDETAGFLYLYGSNLNSGRPLILNLNPNPMSPTYAGYVNTSFTGANHNYVHDGYADNNILYAGHIYGGFFSIINTTVKNSQPLSVSDVETQNTPNLFTHNTWLNGSTLFTTDETTNSYLVAYDISNPGNIRLLDRIQSNPGSGSIVHNTYIINNYAVTSWYKDGFTIVDATRPDNLVQVGNYDTYPGGSGNGFFGCWGVYPYLPSGNILASNINDVPGSSTGKLFVLTPTYVRACYLEGTITDASNGAVINGATIKIASSPTQTENSGSNGVYKMGRLSGGTYTVTVTKTGYHVFTTSVTLSNGVLTTLNAALHSLALPVELTRFDVRPDGNNALLDWETAGEYRNRGFEVQHSLDGIVWKNRGFVPAQAEEQGSLKYNFRVADLSPGTHFFRLQQIDFDGNTSFSEVKSIVIAGRKLSATIQPTVVADYCELKINSPATATVRVEIFRSDGQTTGQTWTLEVESEQILKLDFAHLHAGSYFALVHGEQEQVAEPFFKK
ncbi:MAG: choice-of-anchor B family protein [Saprospiraceae bacterium]|nr:choice-of-anchor B family protein [Saprospiraceae bacterium]